MKAQPFLQAFAVALLCAGGVSCATQKNDPYAQDGGYNPYGGQPGQVTSTYQQYQPAQQQPAPQQQPYQTYNPTPAPAPAPAPDYTPQDDYTPSPKKRSSGGGGGYTVKRGDTLYRIALNHGTTVSRLKSTNGLTSDLIQPGQHLTLP